MINGGNCYEMFFISHQRTISFFVRTKTSDGSIEARICGTNELLSFNEYSLNQSELNTLRQINCNQC
jgi:hypothetical protein